MEHASLAKTIGNGRSNGNHFVSDLETEHCIADQWAFSLAQIRKLVPVSRGTLANEISSGRLGIVKIGRRTLITRESLKNWLNSNSIENNKK